MNSDPNLDPLPDDLRSLWEAERARPAVSLERRAHLWGRVEVASGLVGSAFAPGSAFHRATGVRGIVRRMWMGSLARGIAIFLAGGVVGVAVDRGAREETRTRPAITIHALPMPIVIHEAAPATPVVRESPDAQMLPTTVPPRRVPNIQVTDPSTAFGIDRDQRLAAERTILEIARTALGRSQPDAAIAAVERHAHQFPNGALAEEREVLWIQSLVSAGRQADAQQRDERFERSFPNSMMRAALRSMIRATVPTSRAVEDGGT